LDSKKISDVIISVGLVFWLPWFISKNIYCCEMEVSHEDESFGLEGMHFMHGLVFRVTQHHDAGLGVTLRVERTGLIG
jgi:hypothetical protein